MKTYNVKKDKSLVDFSGGYVDKVQSILLGDNQAQILQNGHLREKGTISKRQGYQRAFATPLADPIKNAIAYYKKGGSQMVVFQSGTTMYKWTSGAPVSIATGLANIKPDFIVYLDKVFWVNGSDPMKQYDGAAVSDVSGSPPLGTQLEQHKNYLFVAGNPTNPARLYFSSVGDPNSWPALNFIDVPFGDGDRITALKTFRDYLVVFGEKSVWMLAGDETDNFTLRKYSDEVGCVAPDSVQLVQNTLAFLSRKGIYFFDGARTVLASENIEKTIQGLNQAYLSGACAINWKTEYWLAVPSVTSITNDVVLSYDYLRTAWAKHTIPASCFLTWRESGVDYLYHGSPTTGLLHKDEVGYNDDGSAIDFQWKWKVWDGGSPESWKKLKRMYIVSKTEDVTSSLSVGLDIDFAGDGVIKTLDLTGAMSVWDIAEWDVDVWDGATAATVYRVDYSTKFRYLALKFQNNTLDQPCSIYKVGFRYVIKPAK